MTDKRTHKPFAYAAMADKREAIDRLDLKFRWGSYGIRVLRCHLASFPPGKIIGFHKHSEYEFHFIPRGKGTVIMENTPCALEEGYFYLTGPNVLHYQESDADDPMEELCLHIDIVRLDDSDAGGGQDGWGSSWEAEEAEQCVRLLERMPLRPLPDKRNAMPWFLTAYRACVEHPPGFYTTMKQAIIQILLRAAHASTDLPLPVSVPSRDLSAHRFELAAQFIQDNYSSPITLEDVAESIRISGRQLQRIFQEMGQQSFSEYVERIRLSQVCWHLVNSDETIENIAVRHGFSSSNYLYYVFKKKLRMTPGQYKERHRRQGG